MFLKRLIASFLALSCILANTIVYAQDTASPSGQPQTSSVSSSAQPSQSGIPGSMAGAMQNLTPEQQKAVQEIILQKGGLTPEAIVALKARPEFQGLSPEEILKGKEMLQQTGVTPPQAAPPTPAPAPAQPAPAETKDEPKALSLFDRYRSVSAYQDIDTKLKSFGYDFFTGASAQLMTPRKDIPVSPDYVVGPGDEVKLTLWGRVTAQYSLVIDKDGNIIIPQIGPVSVAGMTYEQMATQVIKKVEQIVGASVNVSMGMLKGIQVFVTGDVKRPGSYPLDSFSTITTALLTAGGPSEIGSLRNIQLRRNNKTIAEMDFYEFLLKGNKSKDLVLQSGDIVFVPTVGPLAGIAGNVKRPAIYQLKGRYDLQTLLDLSGGLIPSANTQQIQVERIIKNERHVVVDINDKNLSRAGEFMLQDGDLVKVFPVVDINENVITLSGNVKRPGKYEYKEGIRVRDIVKTEDDLLPESDLGYGLIKRLKQPSRETELIPFEPKKMFAGDQAHNLELQSKDTVFLFSKWFFRNKPSVSVEGEVRKPGKIDLFERMTVRDAILGSEGLTRVAYPKKAEILRVDEKRQYRTIHFDLEKAMAEDLKENILLQDEDKVVVHSIHEVDYQRTVSVFGDVKNPGKYHHVQGMRVSDLIFTAGNVLPSAYLGGAEIISQVIEDGKIVRKERRNIELKKALEGDPSNNVLLRPYDALTIKKLSDWGEDKFATVTGEVLFPGTYKISRGERLSDLITRAGGYSDNAYLRGAHFTRAKVKELQQKTLDEMADRLERDLLSTGTEAAAAAASADEAKILQAEMDAKRLFVTKLRNIKATGRMSMRLKEPEALKKTPYDVELEDGDTLAIPLNPNSVQVIGSVYNQTAFVHDREMEVSDYIALSGGFTDNADEDNVYVLKVDGTAMKPNNGWLSWSKNNNRWELGIQDIESGDTIVVPEQLEKIAWLREIKDFTQILYQIAVTAGVLLVAF